MPSFGREAQEERTHVKGKIQIYEVSIVSELLSTLLEARQKVLSKWKKTSDRMVFVFIPWQVNEEWETTVSHLDPGVWSVSLFYND